MAKRHLLKENRRYNTDRESARESASTSTSAKRGASLVVETTLTDRELHEQRELWTLRCDFVTTW